MNRLMVRKYDALDEYDSALAAELRAHLPDKVFDVHAHPYFKPDVDVHTVPILDDLPEDGGIDFWRQCLSLQIGRKHVAGGLFFGLPIIPIDDIAERIGQINRFLIEELRKSCDTNARGLLLVARSSDPAETELLLGEPHIAGFKPYPALNPGLGHAPDIHEFLPEWVCELANRRGLVIMLHISKPAALDDEGNVAEINGLCSRYPGMKLILAHAGAGFNMYNTIKGCLKINKADNLWFDVSAICEHEPIAALINEFGHERLMWGSDYPISLRKGRFVTFGNMCFCLQRNTINTDMLSPACLPALQGLENLRAVIHAITECKLGSEQVEDLFYNNAAKLLL